MDFFNNEIGYLIGRDAAKVFKSELETVYPNEYLNELFAELRLPDEERQVLLTALRKNKLEELISMEVGKIILNDGYGSFDNISFKVIMDVTDERIPKKYIAKGLEETKKYLYAYDSSLKTGEFGVSSWEMSIFIAEAQRLLYGRDDEKRDDDWSKPFDDDIREPQFKNPVQVFRDPLIIDLNRDGKVSTTRQSRYFDLDANGFAEKASWAASGDGLLVLDRDGDGIITSGKELFGDSTVMSNGKVAISGFQALADLDSNKDGVIDAKDELFSQLRVWADLHGDGIFADHELISLEEVGIESIDLSYDENRTTDENGNQIVRTGKVTWEDGDTSPMSEFLLDRNTRRTDEKGENISEGILKMPNLTGMGNLLNLHVAMEKDTSVRRAQ